MKYVCGVCGYVYDEEREEYKHTRQIDWTHTGEWESDTKWAIKTLTDITQYTALKNLLLNKKISFYKVLRVSEKHTRQKDFVTQF